jgi:signal transduction histidine kinase
MVRGGLDVTTRRTLLEFLHRRPVPRAGVLAVLVAVLEVLIDWGTWVELNVAIVYSLPLIVAAVARSRRLLWSLAAWLVIMTFAVYFWQVQNGVFSFHETFFVDRILAAATVVFTAGILHVWTHALDTLDAQGRSLLEQNEQLEAANRELVRHEDRITRQNQELERRRREAEEASGRKTRLLASASHDIRTPVNTINMIAELIRRTASDPVISVQVPGLAQRLQANAMYLAGLLSEVLDTSSFESGTVEVHASEFSLDEMLTEWCRRLNTVAQAKGLQLDVETPEPAIRLNTDRPKLGRILTNLVSNAIKFTNAGTVTIGASLAPDNGAMLRVRDTGVGMASADLERIFNDFARVRDAAHAPNEGWGLGLPISRRLAELIGGSIKVESEPGRGSVFTVYLPSSCVVHSECALSSRER